MMELGISQERYAMALIDLFDGPEALQEAIAFFLYMKEYPGITDEVQQHIENCLNWFRSELAAQTRPN